VSVGRLVAGVAGLNSVYLVVGYCLLTPFLRRGVASAASYAGVALLIGAGWTGVLLCIAAVAGATTGVLTFALVAAGVAGAGLLSRRLVRRPPATPEPAARQQRPWEDVVATAAAAGLVAIAGFALVGGFRSSPWLDDTWGWWVPKGLVLSSHGLVPGLWQGSWGFIWISPDYPLWWSSLSALDLRFVGGIDLRAIDAQLTILVLAFLGALARLLWGHVRPWLLWPGLALVAAMPELFRQAQGGGGDVPLAVYLALYCVCAVLWLVRRDPLVLVGAFTFAAAAVQIKSEGAPQLLVLTAVVSLLGLRAGLRPLLRLWSAVPVALALAAPWFAWRSTHHVHGDFALGRALDPSYLSSRTSRVRPAVHALGEHLISPRQWILAVPLLVALALLVALRERSWPPLVLPLVVAVDFFFWVWVNWSDPQDLHYRLSTSAYRVVDTAALVSAAFVPLVAERLVSRAPP